MNYMLIIGLEDTIIKPIISDNYSLLISNIEKIKQFHREKVYPPTFVYSSFNKTTFSWALLENKDIEIFKKNQRNLEKSLDLNFSDVYTMLDYIAKLKELTGRNFQDDINFVNYYNKEMILFQLCSNGWKSNTNIYFIDSVVKDCAVNFSDYNTNLNIINVNNI